MDEKELMSETLFETEDGLEQIRLTVNEFRGVQYLHLRKYYLDFDELWYPTPKGISLPISLDTISSLFTALVKLLARSDVLHIVLKHIKDEDIKEILNELKVGRPTEISE